ncbi:MAG: MerR family transcriptional regulator [Chlamydiales bacterium]|nr:MerR family transcriptional regulator [Chlamydiales bacterium]
MAYTVKKLSEISGVTVRALHFYEELGLLKPAYYGSNGYRYYEEKELLELQQILFFKELGLGLKEMKKILEKPDLNRLAILHSHKQSLILEWRRLGNLIKTVDRTINHLKGIKKMKDKDYFKWFSLVSQAKPSDSYFTAESVVLKSVRKLTKNGQDLKEMDFHNSIDKIYKEIAVSIEKRLEPSSDVVQSQVFQHHRLANQIQDATQEVYRAMSQLYREHPEFRGQLDAFHSQLADFLSQAMLIFATKSLC